jgi:hypothetical protein
MCNLILQVIPVGLRSGKKAFGHAELGGYVSLNTLRISTCAFILLRVQVRKVYRLLLECAECFQRYTKSLKGMCSMSSGLVQFFKVIWLACNAVTVLSRVSSPWTKYSQRTFSTSRTISRIDHTA